MHIVIATVGTRGDVQPYVALGKALSARGHRVSMATHVDHRELIESNGIEHLPVCGSFRELMASDAGRRWLESADSIPRYLETFRALFEPIGMQWLAEFEAALRGADAVLVHAMAVGAVLALRNLGIPHVVIAPFGAIPSGEFTAAVPRIPLLRSFIARKGHAFLLDKVWSTSRAEVNAYFAQRGVPLPRKPVWRELIDDGVPHLHLFSPNVVSRPKDWPECAEVMGYCFLDAPNWAPPRGLAEFLEAKPTPTYVGFGSMTGIEPAELAAITRAALRQAGQRAVVAMGWGGLEGFAASDELMLLDDAPHDWLFPRVAAVVHHCGAGTTAAALRAGRPSVAVPFFGDQPYWAHRLHELGAAPPPLSRRSLTAEALGAAIARAVSNPEYATRAAAISAALRLEDGASAAADRALEHFARE